MSTHRSGGRLHVRGLALAGSWNATRTTRSETSPIWTSTRVTYSQDVFARTYARTLNTTATSYVYRGISEDVAKSTTSSVNTTYALSAGGSPLGQKVGTAAASFYLRDPHGDTVGIVSVAAQNQGTTSFDPYGRVLGVSGTQPVFGYQSDLTDVLTKQVDMGTRWYGPETGRFSSRDVVLGDPLHPVSLNQWVYGGANPITMWDPTGMRFATMGGGCGDLGEAECEETVQEFIDIETEDPGYWTENFDEGPKPPPPPEPPAPTPVDERSWFGRAWDWFAGGVDDAWDATYEGAVAPASRWAWQRYRGAQNADWTIRALLWAKANGATCGGADEGLQVCGGMPEGTFAKGGTTVGNVFLTNRSTEDVLNNPNLLAHERAHSDQWAIFGDEFAILYLADYAMEGECNCFEDWAGFEGGGYGSCV